MSDPVELKDNAVNSCSYNPAEFTSVDPATSSSSQPEPLASYSSPQPQLDSYSDAKPLRLETQVQVHDPASFGGRSSLSLRDLILAARTSTAAQDEIINLVQNRANSERVNSQCFVSSEATLSDILAQLLADDPVTRREGRLALGQFILHSNLSADEGLDLRLGVLATVARIRQTHPQNEEAKQVLVDVYNETPHDSPLGQGMDQLSNRAVILQTVGRCNAANRSPAVSQQGSNAPINGGGASVALGGELVAKSLSVAVDVAGHPAVLTPLASALPNFNGEQWGKVASLIETTLRGTTLENIPSDEILNAAQSHLAPAIDQFKQSFRLGILGLSLRYTDIPGSQFPAYAQVASRLADRVASEIFSLEAPRPREQIRDAVRDEAVSGPVQIATVPAPRVDHASRPDGLTPAIKGNASPTDAVVLNDPNFTPALTQQAAGMQGAATQGLAFAGNPGAMSFGFGSSSRPSYYVESTTADEGAQDGFSGGSQGGSKGQSDSEGQEKQPQGQPDAYIA